MLGVPAAGYGGTVLGFQLVCSVFITADHAEWSFPGGVQFVHSFAGSLDFSEDEVSSLEMSRRHPAIERLFYLPLVLSDVEPS